MTAPFPFDYDQLEKLYALRCTDEEIAAFVGCNRKTLQRHKLYDEQYVHAMERGKAQGAVSLRRAQMAAAMQGNVAMLIFLGKNYLGQTNEDKPTITPPEELPDLSRLTDEQLEKLDEAARILRGESEQDSSREDTPKLPGVH